MKGRFIKLSILTLAITVSGLLVANAALAGGIINKQNQSADYIRTLARNAATDYADIAAYNPAGIMQMDDGLYAKLDVMYYAKDYSNDVPGYGELSQDEPSITPGLFTIYKKKKWAGFFAFTIPAGGGKLDYKDGDARTVNLATQMSGTYNALLAAGGYPPAVYYNQLDPGYIEVKQSTAYGFTLGASYAINQAWSLAAGARFSTGTREFQGEASITSPVLGTKDLPIHLEESASGWAGILGVNFSPNDKLNAALTYISNTKMEYDMEVKQDTTVFEGTPYQMLLSEAIGFPDGSKRRIDIPGLLGAGVSYRFLPQLRVELNYTYYLEEDAKIDTFEDEGNSWDLGIAAEYTFNPQWKASLGYLRTNVKINDDEQINEPEEPKLDANTIGAGVVWSPTPSWAITLAGLCAMYDDATDSQGITYKKTVYNGSIGIQYKFF